MIRAKKEHCRLREQHIQVTQDQRMLSIFKELKSMISNRSLTYFEIGRGQEMQTPAQGKKIRIFFLGVLGKHYRD